MKYYLKLRIWYDFNLWTLNNGSGTLPCSMYLFIPYSSIGFATLFGQRTWRNFRASIFHTFNNFFFVVLLCLISGMSSYFLPFSWLILYITIKELYIFLIQFKMFCFFSFEMPRNFVKNNFLKILYHLK